MFWLLCVLVLVLGSAGHSHHFGRGRRGRDGCDAEQNQPWSYGGENGQDSWGGLCNSGTSQSPINIESGTAIKNEELASLTFTNYDKPVETAIITNNGHTVQVTPTDGIMRSINGGLLPSDYTFIQLHFHWGSGREKGAEHLIDSFSYPMEMHLVHRNSDGEIAVLGVFFEESWRNNDNMTSIVKALHDIKYKDESTTLKSTLNLASLLPANTRYFRYNGSLTTPECNEGVIWTVFKNPLRISYLQMLEFRLLRSTKSSLPHDQQCHMVDNFRRDQDLNGRSVYTSN